MLQEKLFHLPNSELVGSFLLLVSGICLLFQPTHLHKASDCQSQAQDTFVSMEMSRCHDTAWQCGLNVLSGVTKATGLMCASEYAMCHQCVTFLWTRFIKMDSYT